MKRKVEMDGKKIEFRNKLLRSKQKNITTRTAWISEFKDEKYQVIPSSAALNCYDF